MKQWKKKNIVVYNDSIVINYDNTISSNYKFCTVKTVHV